MTDRKYPLARPPGHKPPVQRWRLEYPEDTPAVHTAYVGVQRHDDSHDTRAAFAIAVEEVEKWVASTQVEHTGGSKGEAFRVLDGDDTAHDSVLWVCYWPDMAAYQVAMDRLQLTTIYHMCPGATSIGLYCERFTTPISRLETNYSGLDYLPGVARLPGPNPTEHTLTAYWGAARDRIPSAAQDAFSRATPEATQPPVAVPSGLGQRLVGRNPYDNLVHIRSGQFWQRCEAAETEAYETLLEPTLKAGLQYLWQNRDESGAMGLRFLRNQHPQEAEPPSQPAKETCAAGFFRNLQDLEKWAKRHPSHLAIFNGALKHAKVFGNDRKMRTWHEVSVLKTGDAQFEYVNCQPQTGVISYFQLEEEDL
ncbi:hypothetical protein FE257_007123 [Aspergillus nanangensis]|uniref:Phenylacetaldoxime dehydratase n=1 Tax=Aspergillus nanangensis TaxID=2582783 RepID=A0AAD4GUG0_ASPNN|nr:hypothetical protein FE257_007123 [Aspergillus nanangensis]